MYTTTPITDTYSVGSSNMRDSSEAISTELPPHGSKQGSNGLKFKDVEYEPSMNLISCGGAFLHSHDR